MRMKVSDAIVDIVEFALPRFSPEHRMLHICVDAQMNIYSCDDRLPEDDREDREVYTRIHFLFQRPHNYTKVFMAVEGCEYAMIEERMKRRAWVKLDGGGDQRVFHVADLNNLNWHMTSDHDSCWTSDGVDSPLFQIWMQMRKQITEGDDFLIKNIHDHICFDHFSRMKFVKADVVVNEAMQIERNDTYHKLPANIEEYEG